MAFLDFTGLSHFLDKLKTIFASKSIFNKSDDGLVPAPGGTTSTKFLREDGSWVVPSNTDTKVTEAVATDSAEYPILTKNTTAITTITDTTKFAAGVTINPSEKSITATTFKGELSGNASSATKVGALTVGSTSKPIYLNEGVPTECLAVDITHGGTGSTDALTAITALGGESIGSRGVLINANSDLNDYTTPGTFYVSGSDIAKTIDNTPKTASGYKLVVSQGYATNSTKQVATFEAATGLQEIVRTRNGDKWSPWTITYANGIVPIGAGGTGAETAIAAQYNLLKDMYESDSTINASDSDYFIMKRTTDNANNGFVMRRPATSVWNWIKNKIKESDDLIPDVELDKINDMTTGINLLRGTRDFYKGIQATGLPNNPRYDGVAFSSTHWEVISAENPNEFAIAKRIAGMSGASHLYFNPLFPEDVNGHAVTMSAEVMFDDVPTSSMGIFQLYASSRETTTGSTIATPSLSTFGLNYSEIVPNTWYKLVYKRKTPINLAENEYLRVALPGNANEAVSKHYRKVKLELGEINDPIWSASPFDIAEASTALSVDSEVPILGKLNNSHQFIAADGAQDFNDFTTPGTYSCDSTATSKEWLNSPEELSNPFKLYVEYTITNTAYIRQWLVEYGSDATEYVRYNGSNGEWTAWRQTYANTTVRPIEAGGTGKTDALSAITALGGRSIASQGINIPNESNLNDYTTPGTYYVNTSANAKTIENSPTTSSGYKLTVELGYQSNRLIQRAEYVDSARVVVWERVSTTSGDTWKDWIKLVKVEDTLPIANGGTGQTLADNVPAAFGFGFGTCPTAASTAAKLVTLANYNLVTGGIIAVSFTHDVPANATLNVNSKGAKNIFYHGAKIVAGVIKAGDVVTFMYDGTQYQIIGLDPYRTIMSS